MTVLASSLVCAGIAAGLMYFFMKSRMEMRLAQQREELAGAQATLAAKKEARNLRC